MKNKKKRKVMLLVLLLLGVSIGFAALSTTLKIIGTTNISKNTWNIYWENKSVNQNGVSTTAPTLSAEQGKTANTIATWNVTLNLPGDFYEFTINAVNEGTIDAMISSAGLTTTVVAGANSPSTLPEYIVYTVTYEDGTAIAPYHKLGKAVSGVATKEAYKVRVEFTDNISPEQLNNIPSGGYSYTFTTQATYVQADDNAIDSHPAVNPYLTRFDGNYEYYWSSNDATHEGYEYYDEIDYYYSSLNPSATSYIRKNLSSDDVELCVVLGSSQSDTVCVKYDDEYREGDAVEYDENTNEFILNSEYLIAKKAEFESKGATCSSKSDPLRCSFENVSVFIISGNSETVMDANNCYIDIGPYASCL